MISFGKRMLLFLMLFVLGSTLAGALAYIIGNVSSDAIAAVRISAISQDLFAFVLPAAVVAVLSSRLPAGFLKIRHAPCGIGTVIAVCTLICSIPLINSIVMWNESITLPESIHQYFAAMEHNAGHATAMMLGGDSVADLIIGILIVGIMAGISEELFFRGAMQGLFMSRPMNPHAAIWITAIIFSAFHMQFFGFVPRLLLGAFFGYTVYWTGSLWTAIIAHVANNSMIVTAQWLTTRHIIPTDINSFGTDSPLYISVSLAMTGAGIWLLWKSRRQQSSM
mgnify:FL=1